MSFANQTSRWTYVPNGVTTAFVYDNMILAAADLQVSWVASDGTPLALPGYGITGVGNANGGTVVFNTAPAATAGSLIVLERKTAATQSGNFLDFLQEPAATRQQRFERCMALAQEFNQAMKRLLLYSPLDADGALVLPPATTRANKALLFGADGKPTVGNPLAAGVLVVSGYVQTLLDDADADAVHATLGWSTFAKALRTVANGPAFCAAIGAIDAAQAATAPQGRLTLSTGIPVMAGNLVNRTLVYYTPYVGHGVPLWNGATFAMAAFAELSNDTTAAAVNAAGPAIVANDRNYDLFVWDDAGTKRLTRGPAWSSDVLRGVGAGTSELQQVQGFLVNKVAITNGPAAGFGTYVGSIRANGAGTIDFQLGGSAVGGVAGLIGLWNYYNRVAVRGHIYDTTASWSYATAAWRLANTSINMQVVAIAGMAEDAMDVRYRFAASSSGGGSTVGGVGLNATAFTAGQDAGFALAAGELCSADAAFDWSIPLGWNAYKALEFGPGAGSATWFGGAATGLVYKWRY